MLTHHTDHNQNQSLKAVILAGFRDFGRCPLASRLPTALWPIEGQPVVLKLIDQLLEQGISDIAICVDQDAGICENIKLPTNSSNIKIIEQSLPVGTAGCIRDAADKNANNLFLVLPAQITSLPDLNALIETQKNSDADMTVFFSPSTKDSTNNRNTEMFLCRPSMIEYIPAQGYSDIKECLVPALLRAGKNVNAFTLTQSIGCFRNHKEYLAVITQFLGNKSGFIAETANVASDVKILGNVTIMDGAVVENNAVILGPSIIGKNTFIGAGSLVEKSVLWDGATVGKNCELYSCVLDHNTVISDNKIHKNEAVVYQPHIRLPLQIEKYLKMLHDFTRASLENIFTGPNASAAMSSDLMLKSLGLLLLLAALLWSYWPTLINMWQIWQRDDEYSSGILVPFLALYVLWTRKNLLNIYSAKPSLWGLVGLIAAQALRYFGLYYMFISLERLSLILSIASLILLILGRNILLKLVPLMLFLSLMLPLPRSIHTALSLPMQNLATSSAVYCLQTLGYTVIREGNVINLNGTSIAVAEACNGLRMVTAFLVIIGLIALLVKRPWWEKLILLFSTLPIAMLCNTIRLTFTAIAFTVLASQQWENFFHSIGGYAMMPVALLFVLLELWILAKLYSTPRGINQYFVNFLE
jgi:exosortase